ncbi:MAG TPA: hypothetical protein VMW50_08375 [Dehalococcoidia bacterium]|nr:hypothetical protein [Dehalococcoidia bacterium]
MIRTRKQLINWIEEHGPRPCIRRAIREGQPIEHLGGFVPAIPGKFSPGWIVRVTSRFGKTWDVGVWYSGWTRNSLVTDVLKDIPWENWVGNKPNNLYSGDNPIRYETLQRLHKTQRCPSVNPKTNREKG